MSVPLLGRSAQSVHRATLRQALGLSYAAADGLGAAYGQLRILVSRATYDTVVGFYGDGYGQVVADRYTAEARRRGLRMPVGDVTGELDIDERMLPGWVYVQASPAPLFPGPRPDVHDGHTRTLHDTPATATVNAGTMQANTLIVDLAPVQDDAPSLRAVLGEGDVAVLGRDSRADLHIDLPQVSRRHASITACSGRLSVTDLRSTHGVLVDGVKIAGPVDLHPGAYLTVGSLDGPTYKIDVRAAVADMTM